MSYELPSRRNRLDSEAFENHSKSEIIVLRAYLDVPSAAGQKETMSVSQTVAPDDVDHVSHFTNAVLCTPVNSIPMLIPHVRAQL
jgi:hypothetical protein